MEQFVERFVVVSILVALSLGRKQKLAERVEADQAHEEQDEANRRKFEEAEARAPVVAEVIIDNQVGRRTDEG